jgi:proline racemase
LFSSSIKGADAGMITLQCDKAQGMSGSNFICTVTVLLETGMVKMIEPETICDTAAAVKRASARLAIAEGGGRPCRTRGVSQPSAPVSCFFQISL